MKFKLVKEDVVNANCYNKTGVSTGDVINLKGYFEEKAMTNPNFEQVKGNSSNMGMTAKDLKSAIGEAGLTYPKNAKKADLQVIWDSRGEQIL